MRLKDIFINLVIVKTVLEIMMFSKVIRFCLSVLWQNHYLFNVSEFIQDHEVLILYMTNDTFKHVTFILVFVVRQVLFILLLVLFCPKMILILNLLTTNNAYNIFLYFFVCCFYNKKLQIEFILLNYFILLQCIDFTSLQLNSITY